MATNKWGIVDHLNWQPFFTFLFFSGIGLILSIPLAGEIGYFDQFGYFSSVSGIFFFIYVLFLGILGLNIGAISAARNEQGRALLLGMVGRVFIALFFSLPFVLFELNLHPGKEMAFIFILLYGAIICLLCAGTSRLIEGSKVLGLSPGFILKYFLFALYFFAPLGSFSFISPLAGVAAILQGGTAVSILLLIFTFPLLLLSAIGLLSRRHFGGD